MVMLRNQGVEHLNMVWWLTKNHQKTVWHVRTTRNPKVLLVTGSSRTVSSTNAFIVGCTIIRPVNASLSCEEHARDIIAWSVWYHDCTISNTNCDRPRTRTLQCSCEWISTFLTSCTNISGIYTICQFASNSWIKCNWWSWSSRLPCCCQHHL